MNTTALSQTGASPPPVFPSKHGYSHTALRRRAHRMAVEATLWLQWARYWKFLGKSKAEVQQAVNVCRALWHCGLVLRRQARWQEAEYQRQRRAKQKGATP